MNTESNLKIHRAQSNKPASHKRAQRANRPVLVTSPEETEATTPAVEEEQAPAETSPAEEAVSSTETPRKRGPRFFSSVGKAERATDQPKADPATARLARALRGKGPDAGKEPETVKEKKSAPGASKPATAAPARPRSNFKMKYIWGIMIYLLAADFLGVWLQSWMLANHLDAVVFTIYAFQAKRSTLLFLALLVVILIVLVRFDLVPRSLGAAMTGSNPRRKDALKPGTKTPTFESKEAQPTFKQGIKGANDDLYREYRENQRYFQKRDRKR